MCKMELVAEIKGLLIWVFNFYTLEKKLFFKAL